MESPSRRRSYEKYLKSKEPRKLPKNIYLVQGRYVITKNINGKNTYFKSFKTLNEAMVYKRKLIDNNWEPLPLTDEELYEQDSKEYYTGIILSKNHRRYIIDNWKGDYIGCVSSIEEALQYRDMYFHCTFKEAPRPSRLDLKENNLYLKHGLKYPLPDRLTPTLPKSNYGNGRITKKGKWSYHIYYGGKSNGNKDYYCACRTYEQAWYVHRELQKCGWNRDKLQEILDNYPVFYTELMELYRYVNLDYEAKKRTGQIKYWITIPRAYLEEGKQLETIKGYTHVEDALYERDFLVAHDWDYNLLVEAIDDTQNHYYDMDLPPYPERKILNLSNRNYHEKELTEAYNLIKDGVTCNQVEIAERLGITEITLRNWLSKFWNSNWTEFKNISLTGENPINVLEKVKKMYTPDLSKPMPSNFNGWVQDNSRRSKKNPYCIRKGNVEYGYYPNEKIARQVVKKLVACNWDKSKLPSIRKSVGLKEPPKRGNVYPANKGKGWSIRHKEKVTRKMINYGYYEDKRIADLTRDFLKENDWDKEKYPMLRSYAEYIIGVVDSIHSNMFYGNCNTLKEHHIDYYEFLKSQYYHKVDGKFKVTRFNESEGMIMEYGEYDSEEKAQEVVELLELNNWDETALELVEEIF